MFGGQLTDVGQTLFDQLHGALIHHLKIIRGVVEAVIPVEAQPVDILFDGIDVLRIFLGGVGVVHAQVAHSAEFISGAEVDAQRFAVADVKVAIGLRGEPGVDRHALELTAGRDVLLNKRVDKIKRLLSLEFLSHGHILLGTTFLKCNYTLFFPPAQRLFRLFSDL